MAVPAFEEGLLPGGRHVATVEQVRAALVEPFAGSTTRAPIYSFWLERRAAVAELVDVAAEWLDGSFTTDRLDPADMDLVTVLDGPSFDALPRHRRQVLASLVGGTHTEAFWSCDAGVVVAYPDDVLARPRTAVAGACWLAYFGHTRDGRTTGVVEVLADGRSPVEVAEPDAEPVDADGEEDGGDPGAAALRAHLARFRRALQAFDDPESAERPGLRLMATALRRKHDELEGKLARAREVALEVRPDGGRPLPAAAAAAVLGALSAAADRAVAGLVPDLPGAGAAVAAATDLRVEGGEGGALVLRAPDPAVRRAAPAPEGAESLVAAALAGVLDAVEAAGEDGGDPVRDAVQAHGGGLALVLRTPFGQQREVLVPPPRAAAAGS
jgi:hypothetical protein